MKIDIPDVKCLRCGHKWIPRTDDIRTCPKCRSPYWDRPKKGGEKKKPKPAPPIKAKPQPVLKPDNMTVKHAKREATEKEKQAFLCAANLKFNCIFYNVKQERFDYCKDCFNADFWDNKENLSIALGEDEETEEGQDVSENQWEKYALACDKKTYDPKAEVWNCHYRNMGNFIYPYCRLCIELEEIWGDKAVGYAERRKGE